jgi:hypothetical protein
MSGLGFEHLSSRIGHRIFMMFERRGENCEFCKDRIGCASFLKITTCLRPYIANSEGGWTLQFSKGSRGDAGRAMKQIGDAP